MITSIVVNGCHNIKANASNKIKIDDQILSIEKDIPFIRYRFDTYTEKEYQYIADMKKKFNVSTHLAEVKLDVNTLQTLQTLDSTVAPIAKYVYVEITEEEVQARSLTAEKLALLQTLAGTTIDRVMLKDKTISLDTVCAKDIIKTMSQMLGMSADSFGVCSSPLSFGEWACLTAVRARELMSAYSTVVDVALPSANHQCMNCCGCIRYMEVKADTEAPADAKVKGAAKKESADGTEAGETKKASTPKKKSVIAPNMYAF